MSTRPPSFLYDLLPIVLRRRDTTRGRHTLRAVTGVAQSVFELLEDDIGALYDNWFVETCDDWVLPYLADLLAIPPLLSAQRPAVDLRRLVANVVEYRRSKGTPQTLADVSRDVLGWPVRILESKAIVARTPHVGAFDSTAPASLNVADVSGEIELGSAFERAARTLDVRGLGARASGLAARAVQRPGTPREIALSVWRAQPMSLWLVDSAAVNGKPNCYTFDPLGHDRRLVNPPSYAADSPPERAVPAPLRNDVLHEELRGRIPPTYFSGDPVAFTIEIERANGVRTALSTDEIAATALGTWKRPVAGRALVDVERGRFVLDPAWKNPRATFTWGTGGDIGGGPYRTGVDTSADPDHDVVVTRDPSTAANA
ncbi:MAG TPA: phage tail protein, partial [Candidatus Elarobacter sp.]|nr:phage tail protein [Candidatus Elarobacter sp.]